MDMGLVKVGIAAAIIVAHVWTARTRVGCLLSLSREIALQVLAQAVFWSVQEAGWLDVLMEQLLTAWQALEAAGAPDALRQVINGLIEMVEWLMKLGMGIML